MMKGLVMVGLVLFQAAALLAFGLWRIDMPDVVVYVLLGLFPLALLCEVVGLVGMMVLDVRQRDRQGITY